MTRALLGTAPAGATNAVRWQDLLAQNTATLPTNGWYLPSANTLGVATNGVQRGLIGSTGGWQIGAPTGGDKGAGTLNLAGGMAGLYFNNTALQAIAPTWSALHTFGASLTSSGVQVTGYNSSGWSGTGAEMGCAGGSAYFGGVTRPSGAYAPVIVCGSTITFATGSGATALALSALGAATFASNVSLTGTGSLLQVGSSAYAWGSGGIAIDMGASGSVGADTSQNAFLSTNTYLNSAGNYLYKASGAIAMFQTVGSGAFSWYTAPSGSAGATATLTQRMALSNTGALTVNGVAVSSDANLKENFSPIANALNFITSLRGTHFDWKETAEHSVGLLAQDVEATMPELVRAGLNDTKCLNYNGIVACLVEAVKEQQSQIDGLHAKLAQQRIS